MQNNSFYSSVEPNFNGYISEYTDAEKTKNIDIKSFLIKVFETLHPNKKMISNWHLDLMIEYLNYI